MINVLTIGLSAFLLFLVQPLISKIILPLFGGGASIWLTSLIFFQALLMAGYACSHLIVRAFGPVKQGLFLGLIILLAFLFLPFGMRFAHVALAPVPHIFLVLLATIGGPYFVLANTTPMVQYWSAAGRQPLFRNPYVQYAVSNAGSLAGLLVFPLILVLVATRAGAARDPYLQ